MPKLKFLWQNEHFPGTLKGGGGATTTKQVVTQIQSKGYPISILSFHQGSEGFKREMIDGLSIIRHPRVFPYSRLWLIKPLLTSSYLSPVLQELAETCQAFFCVDPEYVMAMKKIKPSLPIICRVEGTNRGNESVAPSKVDDPELSFKDRIYEKILRWEDDYLHQQLMNRCDAIVVKSQQMKKELETLYGVSGDKIHIIYNGVDFQRFATAAPTEENKREMLEGQIGKVIITCCGRLIKIKNIKFLLRAFSKMKHAGSCCLVIVGDGTEREALEALSIELGMTRSVKFLGHRDDVENIFAVSDIFVLPSTYESFGNVWVEAMAAGLPCLGLNPDYRSVRVGAPEIISHEETGFLVDPMAPEDMAVKLDLLVSQKSLRRAMGLAGQKICRKKFDWSKSADHYIELAKQFL